MIQAWSIATTALGIVSLYFVAKQRLVGWWLGITCQLVWCGYAIVSRQWAFIAGSAVYGSLSVLGLLHAKRARRDNLNGEDS
jgi:hypothetical protein